ncbi:hypothetical protein SNOG_02666 [Parastagonospora nodorum SN15]|uniref:Uncharacterized protein n=1 Tax=Phaeosphaeria nodorum (strain SN15 / ATCC MYA-4574 / FGSC 10173) TaxID=321614 RepID=Q0UZZ8_PHANO|nr:hypothetical protein SNOG_02666 [Parastagonospora nodorum SN15]EAT89397.1 hypothetical protein SNOG_02666 [Parastagonospora nodorum SN15]
MLVSDLATKNWHSRPSTECCGSDVLHLGRNKATAIAAMPDITIAVCFEGKMNPSGTSS